MVRNRSILLPQSAGICNLEGIKTVIPGGFKSHHSHKNLNWLFKTSLGFCYHFGITPYKIDKYLLILYSLKTNNSMYWYKRGDIELLKQAIEIYEKQRRTN